MNLNKFTTPAQMERNSFLWSEARLVVAAVALFLGGVPPLTLVFGGSGAYGILKVAWLISGAASVYLGYRWFTGGQRVFGGKDQKDTIAFLVSAVSGINLGWTGLSGNNVGMSILSNQLVFWVVGIAYLASAWYLWGRWNSYGKRLF